MRPLYLEHLLKEFVDRESEMDRFEQLLDDATRRVMVVWGDGGIGKSSLLAKMIHEVAQRRITKAELVWTDARNHDYLAVMRKIRDDLGLAAFGSFTDLANYFTVPEYKLTVQVTGGGAISVGEGLVVDRNSHTGDIAGVMIKDLMLTDPRRDKETPELERKTRLTDAFLPCLFASAHARPCVIFLDAVEKMSQDTEVWLWQDFLTTVRDSDSTGVKIVICGRKEPQIDRNWRHVAEIRQLKPLGEEHVIEYLAKRGVEAARDELAKMLLIATGGNMFSLATLVDAYVDRGE